MAPNRSSTSRPKTMTRSKAMPVLLLCGGVDLLRFMAECLGFLGPAAAGAGAGALAEGVVGSKIAAGVAALTAGAVGYTLGPALEVIGLVLGVFIGFAGWLFVGFILAFTNARIFKANATHWIWFAFSLLLALIPGVAAIPSLFFVTRSMYKTQIKKERAALAAWQAEQDTLSQQQQQEQRAYLARESAQRRVEQQAEEDAAEEEIHEAYAAAT